MDFFAPDSSRTHVSAAPNDTPDPFAEAIGRRFGAAPTLTANLAMDKSPLDVAGQYMSTRPEGVAPSLNIAGRKFNSQATLPAMSLSAPATSPDMSRYTPVAPKDLGTFLALDPPPLTLDVRSSTAHGLSRLRGAVSLSAPSTLLKRPNFSLTNLATMIASPSAQAAFSAWPKAERILVYDADLSKLADGSGVLGLLRKFHAAGFSGELAWVVGGHNAVARLARDCLEAGGNSSQEPDHRLGTSIGGFVHAHCLPAEAFHESSTNGKPSYKSNKLQASNPFYDNIRQNRELSHGITERIPLSLPKEVISRKHEIPVPWVREIVDISEQEKGIEALAMQFYRVELGEQRRLQGVMSHHTQESQLNPDEQNSSDSRSSSDAPDPFPFSITAGVEKGVKNRYKNIWPYEHTRVHLQAAADDGSDYVNASFVRPRGTNLQYIATQGPLPATFNDFWTMVWEQNVHVIVMLTRQVEGNQLKCGDYWSDKTYGPLKLQLVATEGEKEPERVTGFDFGYNPVKPDEDTDTTIRRTFTLSHTGHPEEPPRKIIQFQFLPWLDMNVPETPTGLLELVKNVREAANEADKYKDERHPSPVLVHCSAGVGRTGSFVAIDAILDGIRRDLQVKRTPPLDSPPSEDTSESDPETGGDRSTDSVPSSRRRGSFPEVDMATHRRQSNGLRHTAPTRPRQISLRRTVGARKSLGNASTIVRAPESNKDTVRETIAGAAAATGCPTEHTDTGGSTNSFNSSASFNFSAMSLPTNGTQSSLDQDEQMRSPVKSSLQSTHAWSNNVAQNVSVSDLVAPQPVQASMHISTPRPDSEMQDRDRDTFDYVPPRPLVSDKPVSPLGSMDEPIREVLEGMREQRMSLCQSLRQYVFVHRAVVEGVLAMVDEEKSKQVGLGAKRHASPTELAKEKVHKRPSALKKDAMVVDS